MSGLDDVDGTSSGHDGDSESEEKASTLELCIRAVVHCQSVDDCTENDQTSARDHTETTTKVVNDGTSEGQRNDSTDLVHGRGDGSPWTVRSTMEPIQEGRVGGQTTEQGSVETVDSLAEETEQKTASETDGSQVELGEGLEGVGLVEGLAALERLDLGDDLMLRQVLVVYLSSGNDGLCTFGSCSISALWSDIVAVLFQVRGRLRSAVRCQLKGGGEALYMYTILLAGYVVPVCPVRAIKAVRESQADMPFERG